MMSSSNNNNSNKRRRTNRWTSLEPWDQLLRTRSLSLLHKYFKIDYYTEHDLTTTYSILSIFEWEQEVEEYIERDEFCRCINNGFVFDALLDVSMDNETEDKLLSLIQERQPFLYKRMAGQVGVSHVPAFRRLLKYLQQKVNFSDICGQLVDAGVCSRIQLRKEFMWLGSNNDCKIYRLCEVCSQNGDGSIESLARLILKTYPQMYDDDDKQLNQFISPP
jgi:hypothetical protein